MAEEVVYICVVVDEERLNFTRVCNTWEEAFRCLLHSHVAQSDPLPISSAELGQTVLGASVTRFEWGVEVDFYIDGWQYVVRRQRTGILHGVTH